MNKPQQETLFGHPVGLYTLFFTEMWERFSYYGMRALLVFYMIKGFLHYPDADAYKIYGAYTALVYMTPFFGGMVADRLLGARRCVILGGFLMALGQLCLMVPDTRVFYVGLALLVTGNGFFKPNISTMVGTLYGDQDSRRDGGFTIFYMGINLGAAIAPLLCGYIGERFGWHWGFGLATVGMLIGLAVFIFPREVAMGLILGGSLLTSAAMIGLQILQPNFWLLLVNGFVAVALAISGVIAFLAVKRGGLPDHAGQPPDPAKLQETVWGFLPKTWLVYVLSLLAVPVIVVLIASNRWTSLIPDAVLDRLADGGTASRVVGAFLKDVSTPTGLILLVTGVGALLYLLVEALRSTKIERERLFVAIILMFFSLLFWAFFEQAGSSINNFTDRNVDRVRETRRVTPDEVGTTISLEMNQEQLGYSNGESTINLTALDKARSARQAQVQWTVDANDVGMGVGGSEIPASTFQSANPIYILVMGLVFTMLWDCLGRHRLEPSTPLKFAFALLQLGLGFGVLWWGTQQSDERGMVGVHWLLICYFLHTTGELCLSPVGLSMITRLSPARLVSTAMGAWFLATSLSNYLASVIATFTGVGQGELGEIPVPLETVHVYGAVFKQIALASIVSAVACLLLVPQLNKWMHQDLGEVSKGGDSPEK